MKNVVIAITCFATGLFAQNAVEKLEYDFTPPAFSADANGTVFMYFMPSNEGFAANIGLMVQPFKGTVQEYETATLKEFKDAGMQVISMTRTDTALTCEYKGVLKDRELTWYAKAIRSNGKFYLITATCPAKEWETKGPELKASVDSFTLKGDQR